jgi:plasmid stabilization system protein ParE
MLPFANQRIRTDQHFVTNLFTRLRWDERSSRLCRYTKRCYLLFMTTLLDQGIEAVRELPAERQDLAGELLLTLAASTPRYHLTAEQIEDGSFPLCKPTAVNLRPKRKSRAPEKIQPVKLRYTPRALRHLDAIAEYIGARNPEAAQKVGSRIQEIVALLLTFPKMGHKVQKVSGTAAPRSRAPLPAKFEN